MRAFGIRELDHAFRVGFDAFGYTPQDPTRERGYIHARCHLRSPTWAYYVRGVLVVECARCKKPILAVQPAVEGAHVDLAGL